MENKIEFYTFFLGIQKSELIKLQKLIDTFPYHDKYKINVIDKSLPSQIIASDRSKKFYDSPRSYFKNYKLNINLEEIDNFFKKNSKKVKRIKEKHYSFHGDGIEKILKKYSKKKYIVIMDSDIEFYNKSYLNDVMDNIKKENDDVAAVGTIVQKQLFHLSINKIFSPKFLFIFSNDNNINFRKKIKIIIKEIVLISFKILNLIPKKRKSSLGRFPRLHPLLLLINREFFLDNSLSYGYSYLTVLNYEKNNNSMSEHRIFGDSGSTLLSSIAQVGGKVININYNHYVKHGLKGSYGEATNTGKRWNWFSEKNLL